MYLMVERRGIRMSERRKLKESAERLERGEYHRVASEFGIDYGISIDSSSCLNNADRYNRRLF